MMHLVITFCTATVWELQGFLLVQPYSNHLIAWLPRNSHRVGLPPYRDAWRGVAHGKFIGEYLSNTPDVRQGELRLTLLGESKLGNFHALRVKSTLERHLGDCRPILTNHDVYLPWGSLGCD
jgi:hypothetical protein